MSRIDIENLSVDDLCKMFEDDGIKVTKAMATKAKKGAIASMISIAGKYRPKHKYEKEFGWYLLAAEQGNIDATLEVGHHYYRGEGAPQNYLMALEWYMKYASETNNAAIAATVSGMFEKGLGVPANEIKAREWELQLTGGQSSTKKPLSVLIKETEEIIKREKTTGTMIESSKTAHDDSQTITIDSPPSSPQLPPSRPAPPPPLQPSQNVMQQLQHVIQAKQKHPEPRTVIRIDNEPNDSNQLMIASPENNNKPPQDHSSKMQYLECMNQNLIELLKQEKHEKGEMYNTMQKRINDLEEENREIKAKVVVSEQNNESLRILLEQERKIRKNEMELVNQERQKMMRKN